MERGGHRRNKKTKKRANHHLALPNPSPLPPPMSNGQVTEDGPHHDSAQPAPPAPPPPTPTPTPTSEYTTTTALPPSSLLTDLPLKHSSDDERESLQAKTLTNMEGNGYIDEEEPVCSSSAQNIIQRQQIRPPADSIGLGAGTPIDWNGGKCIQNSKKPIFFSNFLIFPFFFCYRVSKNP
jgi:hypothetical protein